jgi:hypothetical protein
LSQQLALPISAERPPHGEGRFKIRGRLWRTTEAFETYWRFAAERQNVFFNRLANKFPLSTDPILQTFKFTNAYRASDRVSQYLIRKVIYEGSQENDEVFFRILLFKLFNKIETWELLSTAFRIITLSDFEPRAYDRELSKSFARGVRIYSNAYIMPSAGSSGGRKHSVHLELLHKMIRDKLPEALVQASSMKAAFALLRSYPTIGDFLAYQYVTDINYSNISNFSELGFVMPGPGAKDGIRKCFPDLPIDLAADAIRTVCEQQQEEFAKRDIHFRDLWGRPLQLIDCQNLFCEVDKYCRVAHPEIAGISLRTRIKQNYRPTPTSLEVFYPPKWNLQLPSANSVTYQSTTVGS